MAYTNSPQFNTYKTVDVAFNGLPAMRSGSGATLSDKRIINMYYDPIKGVGEKAGELRLVKRDGIAATPFNLTKDSSSDVLRGAFYCQDNLRMYWAVNDNVYSVKPEASPSVRTVCTLSTSSGQVGFCSFLKSDGTKYVVISDGTDCWLDNWNAGTCSKIVDADLPTPHVPTPVYIDGYLMLAKSGTQDIYNSDPDDPTSWDPNNFVVAEINPDGLLHLAKVRNYLIAFGATSVEFFWDSGNASGSPFSRNDSAVSQVGYITGGRLVGDSYFFIGQDNDRNVGVYRLDGFKCGKVSTQVVDRILQQYLTTNYYMNSRATLSIDGFSLNTNGKSFYLVKSTDATWVVDTETGFWYEWKNSSDTPLAVEATWVAYNGMQYLALGGQTYISVMSNNLYQDFGSNFTTMYVSGNEDYDTYNWKVCHRAAIKVNQVSSTVAVPVSISWTDDDGLNYNTARTVNLDSVSPMLHRCGKFRKRSWKVTFAGNYPLIMEGMKLDLNVYGV